MRLEHFCLFLKEIGQGHLLREINTFSQEEKKKWFGQIRRMALERAFFAKKQEKKLFSPPPLTHCVEEVSEEVEEAGKEIISAGKAGCLILAGGMGTRLGFDGPKGCFPLLGKKTLFHLHLQKIRKAQEKYRQMLSVAIMTSPANHSQTVTFFENENYFGLRKDQVDFFCQKTLPVLNTEGKWFWEKRGELAESPNGNGDALHLYCERGLDQKRKIKYLSQIFVDNPLADAFEPKRIGFHAKQKVDVTILCIKNKIPQKKMGMLVQKKNGVGIVEYIHIPEEKQKNFTYANAGQFLFSMDFVKKIARAQVHLPLHCVERAREGTFIQQYEKFLFDVLEYATKVEAFCSAGELCHAPLKERKDLQKIHGLLPDSVVIRY